jgi:hypothetical protein
MKHFHVRKDNKTLFCTLTHTGRKIYPQILHRIKVNSALDIYSNLRIFLLFVEAFLHFRIILGSGTLSVVEEMMKEYSHYI